MKIREIGGGGDQRVGMGYISYYTSSSVSASTNYLSITFEVNVTTGSLEAMVLGGVGPDRGQ